MPRRRYTPRQLLGSLGPCGFFLLFSVLAGVSVIFLTPPFQVPDETNHFLRAYAISEGQWIPRAQDGAGDFIPASLYELINLSLDSPGHTVLGAAMELRLDPAERSLAHYPNVAVYPPIPYLPQALGIFLGRQVTDRPLVLFYLGRGFNLLVAILLTYAALRATPAFRWLFCLIALSPMALFLRSSNSADGLIIALAFLISSLLARLAFAPTARPARLQCATAVGFGILCLTKAPYASLAFSLLAMRRQEQKTRSLAIYWLGAALVCGFALALSLAAAARVDAPLRADADLDISAQAEYVLINPFEVTHTILGDWVRHAPRYAAEWVGYFGWLDIALPWPFYLVYLSALILLLRLDANPAVRIQGRQRFILGLSILGCALLISLAQYLSWTPFAATHVEGTQGRYFFPPLLFAAWLFHPRIAACHHEPDWSALIAAMVASLSIITTFTILIHHY